MAGHRFFAAIYDRLFSAPEDAGLKDMRAALLGRASGRVLEVGAGTGLDLPHYGVEVTELVLTEPDPHMAKRLREVLSETRLETRSEVVEAPAESLPFEEASFDPVVSGLVMCSVSDPNGALEEIARVLKPSGRLLFLEHVRAPVGSRRARWQARLERPWGGLAGGCHPNRETVTSVEGSPLVMESLELREFPTLAAALVRPLAVGVARRSRLAA